MLHYFTYFLLNLFICFFAHQIFYLYLGYFRWVMPSNVQDLIVIVTIKGKNLIFINLWHFQSSLQMANALNKVSWNSFFRWVIDFVPKVLIPNHFVLMKIVSSFKAHLLFNELLNFYFCEIICKIRIDKLNLVTVIYKEVNFLVITLIGPVLLKYAQVIFLKLKFLQINDIIVDPKKFLTLVVANNVIPREYQVRILKLDVHMCRLSDQNEDQILLVVDLLDRVECVLDLRGHWAVLFLVVAEPVRFIEHVAFALIEREDVLVRVFHRAYLEWLRPFIMHHVLLLYYKLTLDEVNIITKCTFCYWTEGLRENHVYLVLVEANLLINVKFFKLSLLICCNIKFEQLKVGVVATVLF